jgi:hypothetical protein
MLSRKGVGFEKEGKGVGGGRTYNEDFNIGIDVAHG